MVNVTIKFNYAIKLYLIAKCVACGAGFCDGDWLNEINELLSIFECVGCYFLSPWTCEGVVQCHYIITREEQTCTETTAQHSKYLHFPPFYMPTAMSIIQFRPLVCCECCGCLEDTFTCFCLWFEMTALRFWFSFLGRWKICCSLLCVTGKKSIWNWFSKDLNWNARRSAALDSWERGSKNNNLDKNFCIKEAMKINWRWTWKKTSGKQWAVKWIKGRRRLFFCRVRHWP